MYFYALKKSKYLASLEKEPFSGNSLLSHTLAFSQESAIEGIIPAEIPA